MTGNGSHDAAGAYVLDALPDDERRGFETHLAECEACSVEVAGLSAAAARLGQAVAVDPPAGLRSRVLAEIARTAQEPQAPRERYESRRPQEEPVGPAAPPAAVAAPASPAAGGARPPPGGPPAAPVPAPAPPAAPFRRRIMVALAALAAAVVALGGVAAWQRHEADAARASLVRAQRQEAGVVDVLAASDVQLRTQRLPGEGQSTVAVSRSRDAAALFASQLDPLPAGKAYQVWFSDAGRYRPAGLLSGSGDQQLRLRGPLATATAVCVTVEPAGGVRKPTAPVLAVIGVPPRAEDTTASSETPYSDDSDDTDDTDEEVYP
ncbi:anti-sigma factor [Streptomyces sp. NPDC046876]|uniref:anti-sigma factor n=1 Tax=Streptomyces sp. NPDC046876 TaxID=3155616 RepID=UPI0033EE9100